MDVSVGGTVLIGLKSTIKENGKGIDDIFFELPHDEDLDLAYPSQLHLFHLIVRNNRFVKADLEKWLYRHLSRYVFSRAKLEQFKKNDDLDTAINQAIRIMGNAAVEDELGEMLLYAFLEGKLKAPKLMSRIELVSDFTKYKSKSRGIHFLSIPNDKGEIECQMVFGVSNVTGGLRSAIDKVFEGIQDVENNSYDEIEMVEQNVMDITEDPEELEAIKALILPSSDFNGKASYNNAYGVFLGYTLGIKSDGRTEEEYEELITKKMVQDIQRNEQYIVDKINNNGLSSHSFYFYIVPFDDAEQDKSEIMEKVMKGGISL